MHPSLLHLVGAFRAGETCCGALQWLAHDVCVCVCVCVCVFMQPGEAHTQTHRHTDTQAHTHTHARTNNPLSTCTGREPEGADKTRCACFQGLLQCLRRQDAAGAAGSGLSQPTSSEDGLLSPAPVAMTVVLALDFRCRPCACV